MVCYLRSKNDFLPYAQYPVSDYDLTLDSFDGDSSSVTVAGEISLSSTGDFLQLNGYLFIIDQLAPKTGQTVIKLAQIDSLFDRDMMYEDLSSLTAGGYIASVITSDWIGQSDTEYATPYITIVMSDSTAFEAPTTDDSGIFNFLDYIRQMRRSYNVGLFWTISGNDLYLTIRNDAQTVHPLIPDDGHTQLLNYDYARKVVSKLTVYQDDGNDGYTESVWYLNEDGPSETPGDRIPGTWETLVIQEDEDPEEKVTEKFSENEESQKIELYTDVEMAVGDIIRLKVNGDLVDGTVSGIYRKKKDSRTLYRSGDLITTLQDRLKALEAK